MSTARTTANTAAQDLFATPKHAKGKLTALKVDNQGAALRTVRLQDIFTPDVSEGVASPAQQTIERIQISVGAGLTADVPKDELEDCEFLGTCKGIANAVDASCVIIATYHYR